MDGAFFIIVWLASKAFGARCWTQHTRFLLPERSLYSSVHFAFLFFFLLVLCVLRGLSISPSLSKRWTSPGPAGRKSCYIWFQVSPYSKPHTSLWRLRTSMIHCQGAKHLLIGASLAKLISVKGWLLLHLPTPLSCFLVSRGWFHLRSSCVYFSLIILNFLKEDSLYHDVSHLSLHDLETSTHLCDIWNGAVCGRLTFLLSSQIHSCIKQGRGSLLWSACSLLPRLSPSVVLHMRLACPHKEDCIHVASFSLRRHLSFSQFNSHKVGRKGKILWTNLPILCFVQGHFSLSSSVSWSYFPFCNINISLFFLTSSYSMARKVTQNVWSCWCTARSSCTLEGKHDWVQLC